MSETEIERAARMTDLIERLLPVCNGRVSVKIAWPHRVLHEAADTIRQQDDEITGLEAEFDHAVGEIEDRGALIDAGAERERVMREALVLCQRMITEALPKFNWGASALDTNAIELLNEAPSAIRAALTQDINNG